MSCEALQNLIYFYEGATGIIKIKNPEGLNFDNYKITFKASNEADDFRYEYSTDSEANPITRDELGNLSIAIPASKTSGKNGKYFWMLFFEKDGMVFTSRRYQMRIKESVK